MYKHIHTHRNIHANIQARKHLCVHLVTHIDAYMYVQTDIHIHGVELRVWQWYGRKQVMHKGALQLKHCQDHWSISATGAINTPRCRSVFFRSRGIRSGKNSTKMPADLRCLSRDCRMKYPTNWIFWTRRRFSYSLTQRHNQGF